MTAEYTGEVVKETAQKDIYTLTFVGEREYNAVFIVLVVICGAMLLGGGILLFKCRRNISEDVEDEEEKADE